MDTFRELYPDKKEAYSYWSYHSNALPRNKRWSVGRNSHDGFIRPVSPAAGDWTILSSRSYS